MSASSARRAAMGGALPGPALVLALDWNGTVVADLPRALYATQSVLEELGLPALDAAAFGERFRLPLRTFFADLGVPRRARRGAEMRWNEMMVDGAPPPLVPGAIALLDTAAALGVPVGVVSAAAEAVLLRDIERLELHGRFDFVLGGVSSKRDALGAIVAYSGSAVVYIGDTEHDVDEARRAGARAVGFGGGYRPLDALRRVGADWCVAALEDVAPILEELAR